MPIDILFWAIAAGIAGFTAGYFLDEIKVWATNTVRAILNSINWAIEVTSDALTYLIKEGKSIYKRVLVYVKNVATGGVRREYRQELIPENDIPNDIMSQLNSKGELLMMRTGT